MEISKTIENEGEKEKKYLKLENSSQTFRNIMQNYKNNIYVPSQLVTIESCLQDFRAEKIKRLTDQEVLLEELGAEMKQFEADKMFQKKYNLKPVRPRKRESKVDFLATLNLNQKSHKTELPLIIIPEARRRRGRTIFPLKPLSVNILYESKLFRGRQIKKTKLYTSTYRFQNTPQSRIDCIADDIGHESKALYTTNVKKFNVFQEKFDDWKRTQEFTFVEIKNRRKSIGNALRKF